MEFSSKENTCMLVRKLKTKAKSKEERNEYFQDSIYFYYLYFQIKLFCVSETEMLVSNFSFKNVFYVLI